MQTLPRFNHFLAELRRRRVFRVLAGYAVGAWIVIQVAVTVLPLLGFPLWSARAVVLLAMIGFPIAFGLAWSFDITPEGIRRTRASVALQLPATSLPLLLRYGLLLALILAVIASGWFAWRRSGAAVAVSPDAVAVLPFSTRGSTQFAYLGPGMVDLLSAKLDGAGRLHSVDPRAVIGMMQQQSITDPQADDAGRIAARLGAGMFVLGDIIEAGGNLHIKAKLYQRASSARPVVQATVEGPAASVFALVDSLTAKLIMPRSSAAEAHLTRLADITTGSVDALKSYLRGEQFFRAGQYSDAIAAYTRAVQQDASFALAYYRLSIAAEWALRTELAAEAGEMAWRQSARLSEHDRRLLEALRIWRTGDGEAAERLYRGILDTYPNDVEGWTELGEVLFHNGPWRGRSLALSREAWERLLYFEPDNISGLLHLARVAAIEGNRTLVDSLVRKAQRIAPEGERAGELAPLRAASLGDAAAKRDALNQLDHERDNTLFVAVYNAAVMARDISYGRDIAAKLTAPHRAASVRAVGHVLRASADLTEGRWKSAQRELAEAGRLDHAAGLEYQAFFASLPFLPVPNSAMSAARTALVSWDPLQTPRSGSVIGIFNAHDDVHSALRLYLAGLLSGRLLDHAATRRFAGQLERVSVEAPFLKSLFADFAHGLRAQPFIGAGRTREALAELEKARMTTWYERALASPFLSQSYMRFQRAELLHALGRDDEALQWYNSFGENQPFDLIFEPPSLLRRAEIYEKRGNVKRAREYFQRFTNIWQNCDPELRPTVEAARRRLANL